MPKTELIKINETHCSACGRLDPISDGGYTACCGEYFCDGDGEYEFETDSGKRYCCLGSFESEVIDE